MCWCRVVVLGLWPATSPTSNPHAEQQHQNSNRIAQVGTQVKIHAYHMPKKQNKPQTVKYKPTFSLSSSPGSPSSSNGATERSVNELIQHLRQTQISKSQSQTEEWASKLVPRSVHPSIRNLLELPETPPPRPRNGTTRVGERRIRRPPGPAAPASWLLPSAQTDESSRRTSSIGREAYGATPRLRLDRLPGMTFPPRNSLQHAVLKAMAMQWDWHLVFDGVFLAELPTHLRLQLLSYVAVYTDHESMGVQMQGLKPLFMTDNKERGTVEEFSEVTRLDLGRSIGYWMGMKQLARELKYESDQPKEEVNLPASWEDEVEDFSTTSPKEPLLTSRFPNLRYLSLAHPAPGAASWSSLLNLLPHIATITHLSLAYWPIPTLKPNSLKARVTHPQVRGLSFAYGGTDVYSSYEHNWSEATTILARLSRATYCVKWLDFEGCSEWIPALCWDGADIYGGVHSASGPEWNGSWRGITWLGLGPGWVPDPDPVDVDDGTSSQSTDRMEENRRAKQKQAHEKCLETAKDVQGRIRRIRREGGGKWIEVSLGSESKGDTLNVPP